jgi:hypothetical protein
MPPRSFHIFSCPAREWPAIEGRALRGFLAEFAGLLTAICISRMLDFLPGRAVS